MAAIEGLRRQRMTGPTVARALDLSRSTVGAVLRRLGLAGSHTLATSSTLTGEDVLWRREYAEHPPL